MFAPSRDQVREFFFGVWEKYRSGQPLAGVETLALEAVLAHPEYHAVLAAPERYRERAYRPEDGETNPFLHLALHLSLAEQIQADQPPGVRAHCAALLEKHADAMAAQHAAMECLAEQIWHSQRNGTTPDTTAYLACLAAQAHR